MTPHCTYRGSWLSSMINTRTRMMNNQKEEDDNRYQCKEKEGTHQQIHKENHREKWMEKKINI